MYFNKLRENVFDMINVRKTGGEKNFISLFQGEKKEQMGKKKLGKRNFVKLLEVR
jgi:hypothetical protein